jgi:hypothetical protein
LNPHEQITNPCPSATARRATSCCAGAPPHHPTRPHTAWENGGRRRTPGWAAQPPPRRTAQRQLAGGSAGAQSDLARFHRPNHPTGHQLPRARTPSTNTAPEGEPYSSPGLLRSSDPGFQAPKLDLDPVAVVLRASPDVPDRIHQPPVYAIPSGLTVPTPPQPTVATPETATLRWNKHPRRTRLTRPGPLFVRTRLGARRHRRVPGHQANPKDNGRQTNRADTHRVSPR